MTTVTTPPPLKAPQKPQWAPRIWQGCNFLAWVRLLIRGRFAVHWQYLYIAAIITLVSLLHMMLRFLQEAIFGRSVRQTDIKEPPIFIIGHWRTGTTLLHELMVLDPRFSYPTTYQCLDPNHFLLTEDFFNRWLKFLMPSQRPMDNMKAGFNRPQEDEFALCMLGQPSPYLTIAFPNQAPKCQEFLDLEQVSPTALRRWMRVFKRFVRHVTYKTGKRLVLKSPPHMARIKVLQRLFPGAIFIHIVRDPYVTFPSTVNLWRTLYRTHGLQTPTFEGLEDHVFTTGLRMYEQLEATRHLVDPRRFYELKYEDLIRAPLSELGKLYEHLGLGGFEEATPRLQEYLASVKGYETNKYQLTPELRAEITRRWGQIIDRYAYTRQ